MQDRSPEPSTIDVDALRPQPKRPVGELLAAYVRWLGAGRIVATAASVLAVAVGGWWLLRAPSPPVEASLPMAGAAAVTSTTASRPTPTGLDPDGPTGTVVVHVAGAVLAPGVVSLPAGARVHEAVTAAGGLAPDAVADAVNLAAVVQDGQQVYVPHAGEGASGPASTAAAGSPSAPTGPVDLNRAGAAELDALPGVGPATAAAIVAHRDQHGPFASVDELLDVPGIGPARLESLRDLVTV